MDTEMGQMAKAVMLGAEMPDLADGFTWGDDHAGDIGITNGFKEGRGPRLQTDDGAEVIGFFVAGDDCDTPDIIGAVALDSFEQERRYAKQCRRARAAWARFHAYMAKRGVKMPEARLYLVDTEVG